MKVVSGQFVETNEAARLNALRDLKILDTPPSESFDRLTRMASRLLGAPAALDPRTNPLSREGFLRGRAQLEISASA